MECKRCNGTGAEYFSLTGEDVTKDTCSVCEGHGCVCDECPEPISKEREVDNGLCEECERKEINRRCDEVRHSDDRTKGRVV